jgi:hypothetical protein
MEYSFRDQKLINLFPENSAVGMLWKSCISSHLRHGRSERAIAQELRSGVVSPTAEAFRKEQ